MCVVLVFFTRERHWPQAAIPEPKTNETPMAARTHTHQHQQRAPKATGYCCEYIFLLGYIVLDVCLRDNAKMLLSANKTNDKR